MLCCHCHNLPTYQVCVKIDLGKQFYLKLSQNKQLHQCKLCICTHNGLKFGNINVREYVVCAFFKHVHVHGHPHALHEMKGMHSVKINNF